MSSKLPLSPVEHKILIAIGFLLCGFYFTNISDKAIATYNETVKSEQIEKERIANNHRGFSFEVCVFRSTPLYEKVLLFQFLLIPFLLLLLKKQMFASFIFSQMLTAFILFGYVGWIFETYDLMQSNDFLREENVSFNNYLLFQSTVLEFVLFLIFATLLVIQSALLMRFVVERFQAKIS